MVENGKEIGQKSLVCASPPLRLLAGLSFFEIVKIAFFIIIKEKKDYKIYKENHRVITKLNTDNFQDIIYIEVGALSVGKIINHDFKKFKSCDEKGYFKMGGSTIVILTKDKVLNIDNDILKHATKDIEVKIKYGEKIGTNK